MRRSTSAGSCHKTRKRLLRLAAISCVASSFAHEWLSTLSVSSSAKAALQICHDEEEWVLDLRLLELSSLIALRRPLETCTTGGFAQI